MQIKESWKEHPLYKQGLIEMVPTEWVWQYWGRDVSPMAGFIDKTPATLDELWRNILGEGLYNPLVMRVGVKDRNFRLESGNHRIQVLHKHGVREIPVVVQVREECGPHLEDVMTDATHNFHDEEEILIQGITQEYMRPSDVFQSLQR